MAAENGSAALTTRTPRQSLKPPLGGRSGAWRHRLLRFHLPLALASAVLLVLFMGLPTFTSRSHVDITSGAFPQPPEGRMGDMGSMDMDGGGGESAGLTLLPSDLSQLIVATGYVATVLLALTLLIGPANLLLGRRNPVSSYLARDVGIWAGVFSAVHVSLALQLEYSGQISSFLNYFVASDGSPLTNSFGWGNWTGLVATVIAVTLLVTSSDRWLRELKARRWKRIQRMNYALFALVIAHAFFYGALVRMTSPFALLLNFTVLAVFVGQAVGIRLWRRRHRSRTARQPA